MMNVKSKENEGTCFTFTLPLDIIRKPSDSIQWGLLKKKKEPMDDSGNQKPSKFMEKKIENRTQSNPSEGMAFKNSLMKRDPKPRKVETNVKLKEIEESHFEEEEEKRSP